MKKVLCLILSSLMIFSLTACKDGDKTSKKSSSVDLEKYAEIGGIPECKYALGSDVKTVKEELSAFAESEEGSESFYDVIEGEETVCITNGSYNFYYNKDKEDKGISYIVSYENAFGMEIGDSILTVKEKLADTKYIEEEINEDNAFFMFALESGSVIKCEYENNSIMFVFVNNELGATAIYRNDF